MVKKCCTSLLHRGRAWVKLSVAKVREGVKAGPRSGWPCRGEEREIDAVAGCEIGPTIPRRLPLGGAAYPLWFTGADRTTGGLLTPGWRVSLSIAVPEWGRIA